MTAAVAFKRRGVETNNYRLHEKRRTESTATVARCWNWMIVTPVSPSS
jgi:hypothetical protein